jgi:EpsI family protein
VSREGSAWLRFATAVAVLLAAAAFLHARHKPELDLSRRSLADFPLIIGPWVGRELSIAPEVREVLGPGDFLARIYVDSSTQAPVDLFIAYFPSQRAGDTIHSPQNCLPGAGWAPLERDLLQIARPDGSRAQVNRYVIARGSERQIVLYWYQAHGRMVSSEYWAKYYLVADSIRMNRSDGSLVRAVAPIGRHESLADAQARAVDFAQKLLPLLDAYIPR